MFQLSDQKRQHLGLAYRRACAFLKKLPLRRCVLCNVHGLDNQNLCQPCAEELPKIINACTHCSCALADPWASQCGNCAINPPPWQHCHAALKYEIPANYLVKRFKYAGDKAAGLAMAEQMWASSEGFRKDLKGAVFLAVPLHRGRLLERGFNQSEYLAAEMSRRCGGTLLSGALKRTRATCSQSGLSRRARVSNIKNAFYISSLPANKHIVLVDDVLTTGSTARECSRILIKAGADKLTFWCFARASARIN